MKNRTPLIYLLCNIIDKFLALKFNYLLNKKIKIDEFEYVINSTH